MSAAPTRQRHDERPPPRWTTRTAGVCRQVSADRRGGEIAALSGAAARTVSDSSLVRRCIHCHAERLAPRGLPTGEPAGCFVPACVSALGRIHLSGSKAAASESHRYRDANDDRYQHRSHHDAAFQQVPIV